VQQIIESIGKGGFGVVYKAINVESGETVAIKQVPLDNIPKEQLSSVMVGIALSFSFVYTVIDGNRTDEKTKPSEYSALHHVSEEQRYSIYCH